MTKNTYVLCISSNTAEIAVDFYGSYISGDDENAIVWQIKDTTPFQLFANATIFGCMINSFDPAKSLKVKIALKDNSSEPILIGEGVTFLAHIEANDQSYIYCK